MTDKNKKLLIIILSAIVVALAVALVVVLLVQGNQGAQADNTPHPESGIYYFDSGTQEYTLTLSEGNKFTLYVKGGTESGTYTLADKTLTLDFYTEGVETIAATLEENVVTLTFQGAAMRFLKKISYTVSFEPNGGSAVEAQSVLNGKSPAKPADPVREGYVFVGWYLDGEFKTPFGFGAQPVTADTVLYARWSEDLLGGAEYTVDFDVNYEDAENPDSMQTVGGKLFGLPVPSRDGYEFMGWWVSMPERSDKLTYRYEEGMTLEGSTTLYALWQSTASGTKLAAPLVNVAAGSISWNSVAGARSYVVSVIGADGLALIDNESTSATTFSIPFDTYAAGEYEIRVTALANSGEADNSESVRYYINNALGKVSEFEVIDSMLIFNTVENAQKYLITVVCGNAEHQHTLFDNGTSRTFNFAGCDMPEGGIRFTVTAVAEGYGSTTSRQFVYRRDLAAVEGLRYDEATQTVLWNEVPNAAWYMVSVQCGNAEHDHSFRNIGGETFVSLKECDALDGGILVKVYPKTRGYHSPAASELTVQKKGPATPSDIRLTGTTLSWNAVTGASKYEVRIGDETFESTENALDLAGIVEFTAGTAYTVSIRAIGDGESAWSDAKTVNYQQMSGELSYYRNMLTWQGVIGAAGYEVQVNDGPIVAVSDGATSFKVTLTQAGINVLKVRYTDGDNASDWVQMDVFAHEVVFDSRGGGEVATKYLAVGDLTELPATDKNGYHFAAWYNVPGGPAANGMAYTDELFAEAGGIVLYAHYAPNAYTITYNYTDGGTGEPVSDQVHYENHYQLTVPVANSATGAFGGWFSAPYGMGIQYTDAKGNSLAPWDEAGDAEVYAYWIDSALTFTQTKFNGVDVYMVSAGAQIALLKEVTVPATYNGLPVALLAGNAFKDCTSLQIINLPSTLEQISVINPFGGCTNLQAINVVDVEGAVDPRYWSADGVLFDNGTAATAQPKLLMMPLAKTGSYRIPNGVSEIPERAFANSKLSQIVVSADVTKIGKEAFADSMKLTTVIFENAWNEQPLTIGNRAFSGCTALAKIVLPARLESINLTKYEVQGEDVVLSDADYAFAGCNALKSVTVASGSKHYKSVDGVLYSGDGKTLLYCPAFMEGSFTVPAGTVTIAPGAFIGCSGLTEITFPNTVTLIGECAFYGLESKLNKITFGGNGFNDVTIDKYAFLGCGAVQEVVFESGSRVTTIEDGAFADCTSLVNFDIPASMTRIGAEAFRSCQSLATITFAANGKTLAFGENVFYNCTGLTRVDLPANVSEIPGIFGGCTSLLEVNVAEDSPYFTSEDGVVFDKEKTEVLFFPQGKTGNYTLPGTVKTIANGVFANISGLNKLTISATVTTIGENAFKNCDINEIVFGRGRPEGGLTIEKSAFEGANFNKMTLPSHTVSIGDNAFYGAHFDQLVLNEGIESLGNYAFYGAVNTYKMTLPVSVQTIGDYCFAAINGGWYTEGPNVELQVADSQLQSIGNYAFAYNDHLQSIDIPASVVTVGDYAFADCVNAATINFAGQSSVKTIGAHAFEGVGTGFDSELTTVTIPKSVETIGAYAFYECRNLQTVFFEEGGTADLVLGNVSMYTYRDYNGSTVRVIEHGHVFEGCNALTQVSFPSRLVEIGPYSFYYAAFYNDAGLQVTFGTDSRLATIGEYAFYGCNLVSITIPKSVRNLAPYVNDTIEYSYDRIGIGAYAFAGNYDTLKSVVFEKGGTGDLTIGKNAFENDDLLTSIELPARLYYYTSYTGDLVLPLANGTDVFRDAENLAAITVEDGGKAYADIDGVVYTADYKELVVCPMAKTGAVEIPATVTKIHNRAFYDCGKLNAITFAGGTEPMTIGDEAFRYCNNLTSIILPSNVVSLGKRVFAARESDGSRLESITLSKNLQNFDGGMIEYCYELKHIHVEEGSAHFASDSGVLYTADKTKLICCPIAFNGSEYTVLPTVTEIAPSAFMGNVNLEKVVLPAGLQKICEKAFYECAALTSIMIPNTVDLIDNYAFGGCFRLSDLSFEMGGTGALVVGQSAFQGIITSELTLPATLSDVGDYAFYNAKIQKLYFEDGARLKSLGDCVFQNTPLVSVEFPESLSSIGNGVFTGCQSLNSVVFNEGLNEIGASTFEKSGIVKVFFPSTLQHLGVKTFMGCENLRDVTFAPFAKLTVLPEGTFAGSAIERITIPASVTEIAGASSTKGVFAGCTNLVSVSFAEGSKCALIGDRAFSGCTALREFTVPVTVSTLGEAAFENCTSLVSVVIPAGTTQLGGSLFISCTSLTDVTLNSKTTELPGWMFANCSSLTEIVLPGSVSAIGNNCFTNTNIEAFRVAENSTALVEVDGVVFAADMSRILAYPEKKQTKTFTVPATVTSVEAGIVKGNPYLRELVFEEGDEQLVIGERAFYDLPGLVRLVLPQRLLSIGEYAFAYCDNLMYVNVPATATEQTIGEYAFYGCHKLLEICNESTLEIVAGETTYGQIGYNALNIYTPTEGESKIITDENGFVTLTTAVNGVDGVYLVAYNGAEKDIVIPDYITDIYTGVFAETDITSAVIPEGVRSVGTDAFRSCDALTAVYLPSTLTSIGEYAFYSCNKLEQVAIPASVTVMSYNAFRYCYTTVFLMEHLEQPAQWDTYWVTAGCQMVWGYDGAERTYTFKTNGGKAIEPIKSQYAVALPIPVREGYVFMGWYDNSKFQGEALPNVYYSVNKTTVYAKWMTQAEFDALVGTNFGNAIEVAIGQPITIEIDEAGEYVYLVFNNTGSTAYGYISCDFANGVAAMDCYRGADQKFDRDASDSDLSNGAQFFMLNGLNYFVIYLEDPDATGTFTVTVDMS